MKSGNVHFWLLVLLIAVSSSFWRLGNASLQDWDEAVYAQVSKEMIATGDWLRPHYESRVWIDKPPLLMWSTALMFKMFRVNEFWARAASALAGAVGLVLTFLIAAFLFDRWTGLVSILILATSFGFVRYERMGMTDVPLTMFVLIAIYGYIRLREGEPRWWYVIFTACALAFMVKSMAALTAPAALFLVFLNEAPAVRRMLYSKHLVAALVVAIIIAATWHVFMFVEYGAKFWTQYFGFHVAHAVSVTQQASGDQYYYFDILNRRMFPWAYLLPFAVALGVYENFSGRHDSLILVTLTLVVFGLYQFSNTKLTWYIVPAYPVLAILTARLIVLTTRRPDTFSLPALLTATLIVAMVVPNTRLGFLLFCVLTLLLLFVPVVRKLLVRKAFDERVITGFAFAVLLFYGVRTVAPLYHEGVSAVATLAATAATQNGTDREPMIVFASWGKARPATLFYSGRPILEASSWSDIGLIASKTPTRIIIAKRDLVSKPADYIISGEREAGDLVYGWIRTLRRP